jgi:hypothetical protein
MQNSRSFPRRSLPALRAALAFILSAAATVRAQLPARLILREDFETTAVGAIPTGFTKTGTVAVTEETAHGGRRSLRLDAAERGPRRITKQGAEIAALGGQHWGRLYFKVQLPAPATVATETQKFPVIHSTLVAGKALSPLANDPIEVRLLDSVLGPGGTFQYIYNVQPAKRPEFGKGSKYLFRYTDEWTLAEWFVDHATQTYRLYINGEEVPEVALAKGAGQFAGAEIPAVFESLSFGWNNYQSAGAGFVAWIDDIALSKERIGPAPAALTVPRK